MSRIEFHRVLPSCLNYIPLEVIHYLDRAVKESLTSDLNTIDAIAYVRLGLGDIYFVTMDDEIKGAASFVYGKANCGKILDIALAGGDEFLKYRHKAHEFMLNVAKSNDCKEIWTMGRKGWGKIFPKMRQIGVVYSLKVD